ncbi:4'-phosphopantetheinyl transferase family protein [Candidatus Odyssella acanthamoebae]|uniref:4'-phosphopantetheinyl transferase domain-containing protein n=1 Tax=Candidatus Odyssella acanthamoebae TaxID=91604 RepID=A0A077AZV4_9PROT|nr:4'-phosphopantetheinyl transferase superfamily protein [Candidatus Paracaedibacter acanthamoebae]AIK96240.1 hypothetical protein ID47_05005 [Candidatus Paracaedibacter acanthamoebae]
MTTFSIYATTPVGIDIEWKDRNINIQEVSDLVLSPLEIINFNQLKSEAKFHIFYDIWTKKEAIIKAIGQGLTYPIKEIEIMNSINIKKTHYAANGNIFYCSELYNSDNYAGTVALARPLSHIIQINLFTHQITHY